MSDYTRDLPASERADIFVKELTELTHKFGIGIAGDSILFVLTDEDSETVYQVDNESTMTFNGARKL